MRPSTRPRAGHTWSGYLRTPAPPAHGFEERGSQWGTSRDGLFPPRRGIGRWAANTRLGGGCSAAALPGAGMAPELRQAERATPSRRRAGRARPHEGWRGARRSQTTRPQKGTIYPKTGAAVHLPRAQRAPLLATDSPRARPREREQPRQPRAETQRQQRRWRDENKSKRATCARRAGAWASGSRCGRYIQPRREALPKGSRTQEQPGRARREGRSCRREPLDGHWPVSFRG
jgi:hypothetical protein